VNQYESIPQMRPLFGEPEKREILAYLEGDGFITEYKKTEELEIEIAKFVGSKHCIVVNNGTISLTLAALALDIRSGDEVIVPNYTMIATPNSVKILGAQPIFVDVEPSTLVADIELVRKAITKRTKAIMLVSANGRSPAAGVAEFEALSSATGIPIIEDSAQSLGSYFPDGRHIGRAGRIGSFSFSTSKIVSTGQGGALITDDDLLAMKIRRLKDFGRATGGIDEHDTIGYNFKFTELQACVGLAQLRQLPSRVLRKKEIWSLYKENLEVIPGIQVFQHDLKVCTPWFIDTQADDRESLIAHLSEAGIGTRRMYPPINRQKCYEMPGSFGVSEKIGRHGLWLPSMIQIRNNEIVHICKQISNFYSR
jgi:perosamine synthetase